MDDRKWFVQQIPTLIFCYLVLLPIVSFASPAAELKVTLFENSKIRDWDRIGFKIPLNAEKKPLFGADLRKGDFNGDGRDELLLTINKRQSYATLELREREIFLNRIFALPEPGALITAVSDFNGDGRDEPVCIAPKGFLDLVEIPATEGGTATLRRIGIQGNYAGFNAGLPTWRCHQNARRGIFLAKNMWTQESNVDDVHFLECLPALNTTEEPTEFAYSPFYYPFAAIDARGSGREDLLFFDNGTGLFYLKTDRAEFPSSYRIWGDFWPYLAFAHWQGRLVGDFNGDGRDDLVAYGNSLDDAKAAYSLGDTAIEGDFLWPFPFTEHALPTIAGDFNGDGVIDIARIIPLEGRLEIALNKTKEMSGTFSFFIFTAFQFPISDFTFVGTPLGGGTIVNESSSTVKDISPGEILLLASAVTEAGERVNFERRRTVRTERHRAEIRLPFPSTGSKVAGRMFDGTRLAHGPKVCIGYNPLHRGSGSNLGKWNASGINCPRGFAFYASSEGDRRGPACSPLFAQCCPLPDEDILLDEHEWTDAACKDGWVITGADNNGSFECRSHIRCTKIDSRRYTLGPSRDGVYWGAGLSSRNQGETVAVSEIPEAIRYGIIRSGRSHVWVDGCLGKPFGSLLTTRGSNKCYEAKFRQLRYTGAPGDPPPGTPVTMYPSCRLLEDIFDGNTGCFLEESPELRQDLSSK